MMTYRDLVAWQLGMDLVERVYALTAGLPSDERFGMVSQLRRSAVSIPSNIAEGHSRDNTKDFIRFVSISRGSLAELETQILLVQRLKWLSAEQVDAALVCCDELGRVLRGLRKSLDNRLAAKRR
ncbi:four helix bundle protein [Dyella sp. C11]|uniref:four helix bundle protein n=1 Tax=Dyella sp. C11 TaxID=2126991 RepID=UPI000D6486A6|nr:four helix bundle protein [Dyella sp. C11]